MGIGAHRLRHYFTHSWRYVLPHSKSLDNLDRIAALFRDFDVVALQEVDAGSLRSSFINQIEYLAVQGQFPYWSQQINRKIGKIAQASNGLLSKIPFEEIHDHKLPGFIPGRGAMVVHYGAKEQNLVLIILHLALSKRARMRQLAYIEEVVNSHKHVILMGDFNCQPQSTEMRRLLNQTNLTEPEKSLATFPSWRPQKNIDHILASPSIQVNDIRVLDYPLSDHLPLAIEVEIPNTIFA